MKNFPLLETLIFGFLVWLFVMMVLSINKTPSLQDSYKSWIKHNPDYKHMTYEDWHALKYRDILPNTRGRK